MPLRGAAKLALTIPLLMRQRPPHRSKRFIENIRRGRKFEREEKAGWKHIGMDREKFEAPTIWGSKSGRIDIKIDEGLPFIAIIEMKATDWNRISRTNIRSTVQRHARQIWRYIDDYVENRGRDVCPSLVYERPPRSDRVKTEIEGILNERFIQVVWRKELGTSNHGVRAEGGTNV